ncbi:regulatory protein GemA [Thauera sp. 2A1]|uniref:regulatory protein GemA n=1 Tax=Thauera sp. 2A1 TaxID=2570191 RepID=UPI0012916625|nr:regulatory protein GemA [Thauera sp. 2A1]KAI5914611.1 regulatory protein GemA [Thauera sp. 2A1]
MRAPLIAARAAQHAQMVRRVHAAKTWLKLDDDTYRDVLALRSGGKRSSKDCSVEELQAVMEHLHAAGYPRPGGAKRVPLSPRHKKLWALWQTLADAGQVRDRTMRGLLGWIRGQTENHAEALAFLSAAQEYTLIESLKKWVARVAGTRGEA